MDKWLPWNGRIIYWHHRITQDFLLSLLISIFTPNVSVKLNLLHLFSSFKAAFSKEFNQIYLDYFIVSHSPSTIFSWCCCNVLLGKQFCLTPQSLKMNSWKDQWLLEKHPLYSNPVSPSPQPDFLLNQLSPAEMKGCYQQSLMMLWRGPEEELKQWRQL